MIGDIVKEDQYASGDDKLKSFTGWSNLAEMFKTQIVFNQVALDPNFVVGRLFFMQFLANVSVPIFIISTEGLRGRKGARFLR